MCLAYVEPHERLRRDGVGTEHLQSRLCMNASPPKTALQNVTARAVQAVLKLSCLLVSICHNIFE